jgi:hypothetical protein
VLLGAGDEKARTEQLRDSLNVLSLLRSPSSMTSPLPGGRALLRGTFVLPHVHLVRNSDLPYSMNDGALWAGRGMSADVILGTRFEWKALKLFILPELVFAANKEYDTTVSAIFPARPPGRNQWSSPFHVGVLSIDLPIRFGDSRVRKIYPGQSSFVARKGSVEFGAATENEWWGPGVRNALLLSNNAPGFPHLFVRTAHSIPTPLGSLDARWISGGLTESAFFDDDQSNDLRSIALLGATLRPKAVSGLTLGAARSVFAPTRRWATALTRFPDVFRDVGRPRLDPSADTTARIGADQLFSLFMHWVFPSNGFEAYFEWGRAELPKTLRDFLAEPNHTQGYTVGIQWLGEELARGGGQLRVQAEATFIEQSSTFATRPPWSWYTSRSTRQGYTVDGQVLGAAIGPGSSSQWVALDFLKLRGQVGGYVTRIRWLEDARAQSLPAYSPGDGWCEHDVSLLGGLRGQVQTRFGEIGGDYSSGWRFNVFFKHAVNSCPLSTGTDIRNRTISLRFTPFWR